MNTPLPLDPAEAWHLVGRRVAQARHKLGLSQAQLGQRCGRPQSWMAKIELGHRRLNYLEALHLAEECHLPLTFFDPRNEDDTPTLAHAIRHRKQASSTNA